MTIKIKNICLLVTFMILSINVFACVQNSDNEKADNTRRHAYSLLHVSRSDEGVFYIGNDDLIHFSSAETGEDTLICFDSACGHEPASSVNPDPTCRAALFSETTQIAYYEGCLYYFVCDGAFDSKIYKMDLNGGTRKLIAELPFSYMVIYGIVFDNDKVYYTAKFNELVENSFVLNSYMELVEVSLTDGSYRVITSGAGEYYALISEFDIYENMLYADVQVKGIEHRVITVDLDTLEMEIEVDKDKYNETVYAGVYDEENFYYYNNYTGEIGIYNVVTDKCEVLIETNNTYPAVWAYDHEVFYKIRTESGERYCLHNVKDDRTIDITAKCNDKNINLYDGYSDIFVGYKYSETEKNNDKKTIVGYTAYSLEEIVGE